MNSHPAVLRRRLVRVLLARSGPPRLTASDLLYISLSLAIGFGLGARAVGQAAPSLTVSPVRAAADVQPAPSGPPLTPTPVPKDYRIRKIAAFLETKHSPLAPYAALIVSEADRYALDWTRIVSISGMESSYGTRIPQNSHNAWGLGGSSFLYFSSWEQSIHYVSALLGNKYRRSEIEAVKGRYCPASDRCNPAWSDVVADASEQILSLDVD